MHVTWNPPANEEAIDWILGFFESEHASLALDRAHRLPSPDGIPEDEPVPEEAPQREPAPPVPQEDPVPHRPPV